MKNATPPAINDVTYFDEICLEKIGQPRLDMNAARPNVIASYAQHRLIVPNLENINQAVLTPQQKETLKNTYDSEIDSIKNLKAHLFDQPETIVCPYCSISQSATLDHYVPKSLYPEFSVYSKNLIPVCGKCNHLKGNDFLTGGVRMFFNSYYDLLPDVQMLFSRIIISIPLAACSVSYYLSDQNVAMPNYYYGILVNHFRNLDLPTRYSNMGIDRIKKDKNTIVRYGQAGGVPRIREFYSEQFQINSERNGLNNWEAVLYTTLRMLSDADIEFLTTIQ